MKILIIEDNDVIRNNLKAYLEIQKHEVDDHNRYDESVYKIMMGNYDAVILDLGLGNAEFDGVDICREVREKGNSVPILMLTARTLIPQKIEGLQSGADDYMSKPFDYGELLARVESISRRNDSLKGEKLHVQNVEIDTKTMTVLQDGEDVSLSKLEFNLLLYLAQNTGRTLTKEQITEKVWGEIDLFKESRSVDIYVGYLRKKLGKNIIETVRGTGYIIK